MEVQVFLETKGTVTVIVPCPRKVFLGSVCSTEMEKAVTTESNTRRIPLSDKKGNDVIELTEASQTERTKVEAIVYNSYLMEREKLPWQLGDIFVVHNEMLRKKYSTKRKNLEEVTRHSRSNKTDLQENYMFIWNADPLKSCREGVEVNSRHPSFLGNSLMGVHLFRHVDMCLLPGLLPEQQSVQLLLCKVTLGRSKSVAPNTSLTFPIEPTCGYHSHISSWEARDKDPVEVAVVKSQVYIYEFGIAGRLSEKPSQCLPVALLYFKPKLLGPHCNPAAVSRMPGNALWPPQTMCQPYSTSAWMPYAGSGTIPGSNQFMPSFPYQAMPGYWLPYYWPGAINGAGTSTCIQDPGLYYPYSRSDIGVPCEVTSSSTQDAAKVTNANTVLSRISNRDPRLRMRQEELTLHSNNSSQVESALARSETLAQQDQQTDQPTAGQLTENQSVQDAANSTKAIGAYVRDGSWSQDATWQNRTSSSVQDVTNYSLEMGAYAGDRSLAQDATLQSRTNSSVQDAAKEMGAYAGDKRWSQGATWPSRSSTTVQDAASYMQDMGAYAGDRSWAQDQSRTNSSVRDVLNYTREIGAYAGDTSGSKEATWQGRNSSSVKDAASYVQDMGTYAGDRSWARDQSRTNSSVRDVLNYAREIGAYADRSGSKDATWQSRNSSSVKDAASYVQNIRDYLVDRSWSQDARRQSRTNSLVQDAVNYAKKMGGYVGDRSWSQDGTLQSRTSSSVQNAPNYSLEMRADVEDRRWSQDATWQSRSNSSAQAVANYPNEMRAGDQSWSRDTILGSNANSLVQEASNYPNEMGAYAVNRSWLQDAALQRRTNFSDQDAANYSQEMGAYMADRSWSQDETLQSETHYSSQNLLGVGARERIQQLKRKIERDEEKLTRLWQFSHTRDWSLMSCLDSSGTDSETESFANEQQEMRNAEDSDMELCSNGEQEMNSENANMELSANGQLETRAAEDDGKDPTVSEKENMIEKECILIDTVADAIKKEPLVLFTPTKCEPSTNILLEFQEETSETAIQGLDSEQNTDANTTKRMCISTTQNFERVSLSHAEKQLPLPDSLDHEKDESGGLADATETQGPSSRKLTCDAADEEVSSVLSENQDFSELDLDLDVLKDSEVDVSGAWIKSQYTFPPIELFLNSASLSDDTFQTLDQKVCRLYRKFMRGYKQWKILLAANRRTAGHNKKLNNLEIQLAKMHISVECHIAFLEASNILRPLPLSSWQRGEIMTIEGQQKRLHVAHTQQPERIGEKQYTALIQSMLEAKESIMKATFLPPLPNDSPGNDVRLLHQLQTQFADSNTDCRTTFLTVKLAALERHM